MTQAAKSSAKRRQQPTKKALVKTKALAAKPAPAKKLASKAGTARAQAQKEAASVKQTKKNNSRKNSKATVNKS